jgi:hypothetical protein
MNGDERLFSVLWPGGEINGRQKNAPPRHGNSCRVMATLVLMLLAPTGSARVGPMPKDLPPLAPSDNETSRLFDDAYSRIMDY